MKKQTLLISIALLLFAGFLFMGRITGFFRYMETTAKGKTIADFSQEDPFGASVSIADYRGKYVLLDFWASWCRPCRMENPHLVRNYQQFAGKDFDILGVSLDTDRENWLNAIEKDGLAWTQISDLKGWDNAVAKQFGIQFIPQNILIDPNGVIIGQNLEGTKLDEKLKEVLKK